MYFPQTKRPSISVIQNKYKTTDCQPVCAKWNITSLHLIRNLVYRSLRFLAVLDERKRKYGCIGHQSDGENGDIHMSGNQILGPLWRVEVPKTETRNRNYSEKWDGTHTGRDTAKEEWEDRWRKWEGW